VPIHALFVATVLAAPAQAAPAQAPPAQAAPAQAPPALGANPPAAPVPAFDAEARFKDLLDRQDKFHQAELDHILAAHQAAVGHSGAIYQTTVDKLQSFIYVASYLTSAVFGVVAILLAFVAFRLQRFWQRMDAIPARLKKVEGRLTKAKADVESIKGDAKTEAEKLVQGHVAAFEEMLESFKKRRQEFLDKYTIDLESLKQSDRINGLHIELIHGTEEGQAKAARELWQLNPRASDKLFPIWYDSLASNHMKVIPVTKILALDCLRQTADRVAIHPEAVRVVERLVEDAEVQPGIRQAAAETLAALVLADPANKEGRDIVDCFLQGLGEDMAELRDRIAAILNAPAKPA
jgi:hypothetical protein